MAELSNLFSDLPKSLPEELIEVLAANSHLRIERIVSTGQHSPPDFWYDQDEAEWVALLKGSATLEFADEQRPVELHPGDYILIPAHQKHRVAKTSTDEPTVWLAIFFRTG
ncbi:cupin domain-containing protein [Rubinisphaera margarita]|uniref:cupin domain-containing protein n=1 Tax=Rubinisphaera margarita TaxID=2909586 RepID=UPI001EE815FA|nr:cupin domain-containing protein [Rubinisphaera margarita]MCG6155590.1 cupin domain-containing protein [Rubinisphaera margarita]